MEIINNKLVLALLTETLKQKRIYPQKKCLSAAKKMLKNIKQCKDCVIAEMLRQTQFIREKVIDPMTIEYESNLQSLKDDDRKDTMIEALLQLLFLGEDKDQYHIQSQEPYKAVIDDRFYVNRQDIFDEIGEELEVDAFGI